MTPHARTFEVVRVALRSADGPALIYSHGCPRAASVPLGELPPAVLDALRSAPAKRRHFAAEWIAADSRWVIGRPVADEAW